MPVRRGVPPLEGEGLQIRQMSKVTGLEKAFIGSVQEGDLDLARSFLLKGVNVNYAPDGKDVRLTHYFCLRSGLTGCMQTALHWVSRSGILRMCKLIIAYEPDLEVVTVRRFSHSHSLTGMLKLSS